MSFIPNTTPTPNWLYNGEMKKMNETELKVVLLVTRKTLGWFDPMTNERKTQDYISQSQFMDFTGQSNRAVATAINICVKTGWIIAKDKMGNLCDTPEKRARRKIWYQLGTIFLNKISGEESSQDNQVDKYLVKKVHQSGELNDINLVKKVHSTKETITKETFTKEKLATPSVASNEINQVLESFKSINPSYKQLFKNKTQRGAVERLVKQWGMQKLMDIIGFAAKANKMPYAPTIHTPLQLEEKMGALIDFAQKEKIKLTNKRVIKL